MLVSNSYFQFKQFRIEQDRCAMKVCTDACVFGAYIHPEGAKRILDIGTGTSLLSLMLAQKCLGSIDAIEIDESAASQARENVERSIFAERIRVHHISIQDFAFKSEQGAFDFICCNPPYFENCMRSVDPQRRIARHTDTLPFRDLAAAIAKLLTKTGKFYVHVPIEFEASFCAEVIAAGLSFDERIAYRHSKKMSISRVFLGGGFDRKVMKEDELILRLDDESDFSVRVRAMLFPYYASLL